MSSTKTLTSTVAEDVAIGLRHYVNTNECQPRARTFLLEAAAYCDNYADMAREVRVLRSENKRLQAKLDEALRLIEATK